MSKLSQFAMACVIAFGSVVVAADSAGLPLGESVAPFNVRDVTGPSAGKTLCYRCKFGSKPVVTIFTRDVTPEVVSLVKKVDSQIAANKDKQLSSFVVVLTNDPDTTEAKLKEIAKKEKISVPLTIMEGDAGPEEYKLQKEAETTVMMWVDGTLKVNEAFSKGKLDKKSVDTVAGQTKKILD